MKIPYYTQDYEWSCGAACMRMVLESLGIKKTENQMIKLLGGTKKTGTLNMNFPALAEKYKLNYKVKRNASINNLKNALGAKYKLIICYYIAQEKIGHYSVVKKIDDTHIYLFDPSMGKNHTYSIRRFLKIWRNGYEKDKRWFFGVKH